MSPSSSPQKVEFSRIIDVADLSQGPIEQDFAATEAERTALATRFGLGGLNLLEGHARLSALEGDEVLLEASFQAQVGQICSVTLEPLNERIEASFSQVFSSSGESETWEGEISQDTEISDVGEGPSVSEPPEPLDDGKIDLGECVAEELAVRINPAPRKKGVEFEGLNEDEGSPQEAKGPFAALAQLKGSNEPQQ